MFDGNWSKRMRPWSFWRQEDGKKGCGTVRTNLGILKVRKRLKCCKRWGVSVDESLLLTLVFLKTRQLMETQASPRKRSLPHLAY